MHVDVFLNIICHMAAFLEFETEDYVVKFKHITALNSYYVLKNPDLKL